VAFVGIAKKLNDESRKPETQRRINEAVDLGLGPIRSRRGPLGRAAEVVLASLASRKRAE